MSRYFFVWGLVLMLLALPLSVTPARAQRTQVAAALVDNAVLVTSSFTGAKVTIFGSVRAGAIGQTDIVVAVRGPDRPAWIGKRKRSAGLWIGEDRIYFAAAPTFFGIASARPLEEIAPSDTLSLYGLRPKGQLDIAKISINSPLRDSLVDAFVAQRQREKLYLDDANGVQLLKGGLFRADIMMPDRTPPGLYTAKVMVFRNGRPAQSTLTSLVVTKVGAERALFEFARDYAMINGLVGVCMALLAGIVAANVFRRFVPN
ncbi:TIGR02186 family protein [Candidatus Phycosocius spiralis]|uniref:Transmembrane protein n=1 Tax=Candidatus Phycosocius spiralis TaxID=2815099 RepID=A0ABQ4PXJ9_9PROT|nr:TIGR02186 family protein [Candidatus Phycosocius spiralis]GIU67815.1 hypothetical protein PsB1_1969 [Candidatus Phycosocius spiralis]